MKRIVVFDVETPNAHNDRICSIAVTFVIDGEIVSGGSYLVNPETHFDPFNIQLHGITPAMVANEPLFPQVWSELSEWFTSSIVVAHNTVFDLTVLRKTLAYYGLPIPQICYSDTMQIARSLRLDIPDLKLSTLCEYFGVLLCHHHDAECDAEACAQVLLALQTEHGAILEDFLHRYPPDVAKASDDDSCACAKYKPRYKEETQSLQMLLGILLGIISDSQVNEQEFLALTAWLTSNRHLAGNYPFDRVYSSISHVLEDGIIEQRELDDLLPVFRGLIDPASETAAEPTCDKVDIVGKSIVLTGEFSCASRPRVEKALSDMGALCKGAVSRKTDYVVIGELGSPDWKFGNFGGKVQKAVEFSESGASVTVLKEKDFLLLLEGFDLCLTN